MPKNEGETKQRMERCYQVVGFEMLVFKILSLTSCLWGVGVGGCCRIASKLDNCVLQNFDVTLFHPGGPLCVTDANLVLRRLLPEYFPKIFGASEDQPLDKETSIVEFEELTKQVHTVLYSLVTPDLNFILLRMGISLLLC